MHYVILVPLYKPVWRRRRGAPAGFFCTMHSMMLMEMDTHKAARWPAMTDAQETHPQLDVHAAELYRASSVFRGE